ncbi:excisionase family DNA-binding protein [Allokutzneria albata]|uniref:DNA binding domain-containing protein, excisionase family n=1 Tax=Allokutzneria albata TaxID=211114 RepID=A0A1G9WJL9_ALLAB|nr:excisionase family DNA-binding protein [Allokutzneria albata]SDM84366.1 DNA binding domain-containing protein, excisionase family [Allokutzneria albata]
MSRTGEAGKVAPGVVDREVAARALRRVKDYLISDRAEADELEILVEGGPGVALVLPRPAVEMFAHVLAAMANGQGVQIMPLHAELTTQQAADQLNVSRPYLIGLLERGEIPFRLVGRHRRIRFDDLVDYQRRDDLRRKDAIDELTRLDQELGSD